MTEITPRPTGVWQPDSARIRQGIYWILQTLIAGFEDSRGNSKHWQAGMEKWKVDESSKRTHHTVVSLISECEASSVKPSDSVEFGVHLPFR